MSFNQFDALFPQRLDLKPEAEVLMVILREQPWLPIEDVLRVIIAHTLARQSGGRFILHRDDTDPDPLWGNASTRISNLLSWLDLSPDEFGDLGDHGPYLLSARQHLPYYADEIDLYKEAVHHLIEEDQAYFCFCQSDPQPNPPPFFNGAAIHEQRCSELSAAEMTDRVLAGEKYLIRFRVRRDQRTLEYDDPVYGPQQFDLEAVEDFALLTPQVAPMPYLAHVVDNHFMQVTTQVRRSSDLALIPQELLLSRALGWDMPRLIYLPPLDTPPTCPPFEDISVDDFKQQGYLAQTLINYLTQLLWHHPEGYPLYPHQDFQTGFVVEQLNSNHLTLNYDLLNYIQEGYTISKL